jgi:nicotinamide-nucleotide amidase
VPRGATVLENAEGTAPGLLARVGSSAVYLLPGPPREVRAVFEAHVRPRLEADPRRGEVASRVVWTAGVPESDVAAPIAARMAAAEPVVGTHPDEGEVAVRILARGPRAAERADAVVSEARAALGDAVVSESDDVRVQHALVALLRARGAVVATAESVTGGLIARTLCEVPGASAVFRGGWVTYSDAWKVAALGVDPTLLAEKGAVSAEVARAMAEGALVRALADVALASTGVAGPGPDEGGVEQGTVFVACALAGEPTVVREAHLPLPRLPLQRRAAVLALDLARRRLLRGALGPGPR